MQTKKGSIFEVCCNTGSGIICSMIIWNYLFVPLFDAGFAYQELRNNFMITIIFTVVSVARGYVWRRCFNYFAN